MLDLALTGFALAFLAAGARRPFIWVLAYIYFDIVAPQKMSYALLASMSISLVAFVAAFGGWLVFDSKAGSRFTFRQALIVMLLFYCGCTTLFAEFPEAAAAKWSWVWKALVFAAFLPLTLRTRLRLEATALIMILAVATIIISGGVKTVLGSGGYGSLSFMINDNTGLYEGSIISTVAITVIPLIIWLARYGTIFPKHWTVTLFAAALVFACLLIPIGTQARTGLLCIGLLSMLMLRTVKRPLIYIAFMLGAVMVAIPFLPESYTARMSTIENHQADQSASTRVAVWKWTLDYAKDHPFGGGFDAFLGNTLSYNTVEVEGSKSAATVTSKAVEEKGRAYHSSYFEMLGEQGWPGLFIWLLLQGLGIIQLEMLRFRLKRSDDPLDTSDRALALALQQGHIVYLLGALFVGIAYQPFVYMLIGLQIALVEQVRRRRAPAATAGRTARGMTPPRPSQTAV